MAKSSINNDAFNILFGIKSDDAANKQIINKMLQEYQRDLKNSPLKLDVSIKDILKKLSHVRLEYDKTIKTASGNYLISGMNANYRASNGKNITGNYSGWLKNDGTVGAEGNIVSNINTDKMASKYIRRINQIIDAEKKLASIKHQDVITEKDLQIADRYEKRLNSLNGSMLNAKQQLLKAGMSPDDDLFKFGAYKMEDASNSAYQKDKQFTAQQEQKRLKENNQFLKDYEKTQKNILTYQKAYWDEDAKANSNAFKNTKESQTYRKINNELLQKELKTAREKEIIAKRDPELYSKTMELQSKYRAESERLYASSKSQYALNKGLFADMMSGWKEATARIINYSVIYRSFWGLIQGFKAAVATIQELNKAFTDIQMVTGYNDAQIQQLSASYVQLAKNMGSTVTEVASGATEWLRQGKTTAETSKLLEQSMILSKVGAMESAEATQYLTSTMNGYQMSVEDASRVVDVFSKLDMSAATSSKELAIAFSRTANSANDAGVPFEKLAGYITTVSEATRRSASTVGEAFKTIFARIQNVKVGKVVDDETGESINDVEKSLSSLGIQLRKSPTEWREAGEVIDEIGAKWSNYNDLQKNTIVTSLAGVRQAEIMRSLFNNFGKSIDYVDEAYSSAGSSAEKYGVYLDSIEAKTNTMISTFQEIAYQPGFEELYKRILDIATAFGGFLNTLAESPATIGVFGTALLTALGPKVVTNAKGLLYNFEKYGEALIKVGNVAKNSEAQFTRVVYAITDLTQAQKIAIVTSQNFTKAKMVEALTAVDVDKAIAMEAAETAAASAAQKGATVTTVAWGTALKGLWATLAVNPLFWIGVAIAGVYAFAKAWDYFNVTFEENIDKLNDLKGEYDEVSSKLDELNNQLSTNYDRIKELNQLKAEGTNFSDEQQKELDNLTAQNILLQQQIDLQEQLKEENKKEVGEQALATINTKNVAKYTNDAGLPSETPVYYSPLELVKKAVSDEELATKRIIDLNEKRMASERKLAQAKKEGKKTFGLTSEIEGYNRSIESQNKIIEDAQKVQDEYNIKLLEVASSLDLNDANQKKAYESITQLINKEKELRDIKDTSTTPELSEQEKLAQEVKDGTKSIEDYGKAMQDANKASQEYMNKSREVASAQTYLSGVIDKVSKSESLSLDEKNELLKVFPSLKGAIYETADGFSVEKITIDLLNGSLSALQLAYQNAQTAMNEIALSATATRIGITETEIASLTSYAEAFDLYMGKARSLKGVYEKDAMLYYGNDANNNSATGFKKALLELGKAREEINKYKTTVGNFNPSAVKDKGSSSSSPSAIDGQDMSDATVKAANEEEKKLALLGKSLETQIKIANKAKDYTKELELQSQLLRNQADRIVELKNANSKISAEAQRLRKANPQYDTTKWFDVNGEATSSYIQLLESFTGKTDEASKNSKQAIETLFKALYGLKQGWYVNEEAIISLKDEMDSVQQSMNDVTRTMYEAEQKSLEKILEMTRDLIKQEKEDKKDALDDKLDAYKDMVSLKKKELELESELYSYNKDLASKQKEIAKTEAKLLEIQYDDSASANAQRLTLEEQLAQQKLEVEEFQKERSKEIQEDALDEEQTAYEKQIKEKKKKIDDFLNNVAEVTEEAYDRINSKSDDFYNALMDWNLQYGDGLKSTIVKTWEDAYKAMEKYKNGADEIDFGNAVDTVSDELENIDTNTSQATEQLIRQTVQKMKANSLSWLQTTNKAERDRLSALNQSLGKSIGATYNSAEGKWYLNGKPLYDQYHTGGIVGGVKLQANEEFSKLLKGEVVSTEPQMKNFMNKVLPQIVSKASDYTNSIGDVAFNINVEGNLDKTVIPDVKQVADDAIKKLNTGLQNKGITRTGKNFSL